MQGINLVRTRFQNLMKELLGPLPITALEMVQSQIQRLAYRGHRFASK
jgi:hypothetical protein